MGMGILDGIPTWRRNRDSEMGLLMVQGSEKKTEMTLPTQSLLGGRLNTG